MARLGGDALDEPVSFPKSDDEWHERLWGDRDNIERTIRMKYAFKQMKTTAAHVPWSRLKQLSGVRGKHAPDDHLNFIGSWRVPLWKFQGQGVNRKWMNPDYAHKRLFPEACGLCGCGIPIVRRNMPDDFNPPTRITEHNEGCCTHDRMQGYAELWRERKAVLEQTFYFGKPMTWASERLAFDNNIQHIPSIAQKCGINTTEAAQAGRRRVVRSLIVLLREYHPKDVAYLYDVKTRWLSQMVNEESTSSSQALYLARQKNSPDSILDAVKEDPRGEELVV
ncbi:hypothetical protein [Halomonas sp.]|uniref:hypothetical protein n=1 Tax=Halomonas sp. TaxID=1486246 RepID=UPI003565FC2C